MWKKRSNLSVVPSYTMTIIEDLQKAYGVKRYRTSSGALYKSGRLEQAVFNINIPEVDAIYVTEHVRNFDCSIFHNTYTMACHNSVSGATYLYVSNSRQRIKIVNGKIVEQETYLYIGNYDDLVVYAEDDEIETV